MTTNNPTPNAAPVAPAAIDTAAFKQAFKLALPLFALYEIVSFTAYVYPALQNVVFVLLLGVTAYLAFKRFETAVLLVMAELFVGSQGGYMITFGANMGLEMSIRHAIFLLVVAIWFGRMLADTIAGGERRVKAWQWWRDLHGTRILVPFAVLMGCIVMGIVRGVLHGNDYGTIFFDVDRSFYFGLFPALVIAFASPRMAERTAGVLVASVVTSVFKALTVLFFFSHRVQSVAKVMYVWVRDTRVGEITIMVADYYRVFFQSQLFVLISLFAAALLYMYAANKKSRAALLPGAYFVWSMVSLLLSLSRSFWFGGAVATLLLAALLIWGRARQVVWERLILLGLVSITLGLAVIGAVYAFPWPNKNGNIDLTDIFGSRLISLNDDAAKSRWALLPQLNEAAMKHPILGSGYGTTVTYETHDPRLLAANKTGSYTTYAFEWGYHDIWLKIGAVGSAVYAWFLFSLLRPMFRRIFRSREDYRETFAAVPAVTEHADADTSGAKLVSLMTAGICIGTLSLLATNTFSPYLNHPLGIGVLMLVGAMGANRLFEKRV